MLNIRRLAAGGQTDCYADGEASLAAKTELAGGPVLTSLVGYSLIHNTLDNNKNPTSGIARHVQRRISPASAAT